MKTLKQRGIIILGIIAAAVIVGGGYLLLKYGLVGSYYAVEYKINQLTNQYIIPNTASAQMHTAAQGTTLPFIYTEIDSTISGDCKMVGDIDGDGFPDLIIGGMPDEKLNWYRYPNWEKTVIATPAIEFTTDGALGDVDKDGDLDIIVPDGDQGSNLLWFENPRPKGNPAVGSQWVRRVIGSVGGYGKDVHPADYDGNGLLDVATRNSDVVMVFFQTSANQWTKAIFNNAQAGQEGMGSGDIDKDGDTDLVLQGVWLRNPGGQNARTLSNWKQYTIGDADGDFKALVVDLNQDGKMDVLFSSSENTADVNWWTPATSDPTGQWTKRTIVPSLERAHTLRAADMDGDGDLDVVLGQMHTSSGEIFIMSNLDRKATTWEKQPVGEGGLHNGVVADIGNDGDYDIFGANWTGNPPVKLWVNQRNITGKWTYKHVTSSHEQTFGLGFGDLTGDSKLDIISGRYWYRNPGGDMLGNWTQSAFPSDMHAALFVKVDADASPDVIAVKDEGDIALYWLEATNTSATAWNAVKIGTLPKASHSLGSQGYKVGQVEAGGNPEIIFSSGNGIYYFRIPANPAGGNWPRVQVNTAPSDEGFGLGDMDRDGDLDIAATTGDAKGVVWYQNPGNGAANWAGFKIGDFSEAIYPDRTEVADLNGDGKPDIIVTEENGEDSQAETFWWQQPTDPKAGNWPRKQVVSQGTTNSLDVADIDGDKDIDLVLAEHRGDQRLTIWKNNGSGTFTGGLIAIGYESHLGGRLADLDGDTDLDIVSIAWDEPDHVHLWRNDRINGNTPTPTATPKSRSFLSIVINGGQQPNNASDLAETATPAVIIPDTGPIENVEPVRLPGVYTMILVAAGIAIVLVSVLVFLILRRRIISS